jgi:hypothetical protein
MNQAEITLLRAVIETTVTTRELGDAPAAKGLQSAGMATLTYLDEGHRLSVRATETGRRWHILQKARRGDQAFETRTDSRARKLMGATP